MAKRIVITPKQQAAMSELNPDVFGPGGEFDFADSEAWGTPPAQPAAAPPAAAPVVPPPTAQQPWQTTPAARQAAAAAAAPAPRLPPLAAAIKASADAARSFQGFQGVEHYGEHLGAVDLRLFAAPEAVAWSAQQQAQSARQELESTNPGATASPMLGAGFVGTIQLSMPRVDNASRGPEAYAVAARQVLAIVAKHRGILRIGPVGAVLVPCARRIQMGSLGVWLQSYAVAFAPLPPGARSVQYLRRQIEKTPGWRVNKGPDIEAPADWDWQNALIVAGDGRVVPFVPQPGGLARQILRSLQTGGRRRVEGPPVKRFRPVAPIASLVQRFRKRGPDRKRRRKGRRAARA